MTMTRQRRLLLASLIIIPPAAHAQGGASAIPGFSIGDFTSAHAADPSAADPDSTTTNDESQMIASTEAGGGWTPACPAGHSGHVHSPDCIMYAMCGNGRPPSEDYEIYHCDIGTLFDITTLIWNEEMGGLVGSCVSAESVDCIADEKGTTMIISPTPTTTSASSLVTETTTTTTTPSPTVIVGSSTEDGATTTTTAYGMTDTPTTDLFATVTNAVMEDLNEANSIAEEAAASEAESSETTSSSEKEVWMPDCTSGAEQSSYTGNIVGPQCTSYATCVSGVVAGVPVECTVGTLYNKMLGVCDHEANVICYTSRTPSPTTTTSTIDQTNFLELFPTLPPETRSPSANYQLEDALDYAKYDINTELLISSKTNSTGGEEWLPSTVYRYDGLLRALRIMYLEGVGDFKFYIGEDINTDDSTRSTSMGLVNIAAFLAQSMKETIKYDACDENNWDVIDGKYPISNSCGQLNQTYQEYTCPADMEHMACEVDINMEQVAYTNAKWYGAPGPLYCGPKSKYPFTGHWDYGYQCDFSWEDPPRYCEDYEGQKGGQEVTDEPMMNRVNRSDVEGCCWWGRGVIQTTGICNFGILNYYLGKRAADDGRDSRYPDVDFCEDPGVICNPNSGHPELKWISGLFYWIRQLQPYDDGWNYIDNLKNFVEGGMQDDTFIDSVSGIVNRGCHSPPCPNGSGALDGGEERKENFKKALEVLLEPDGTPRVFRSGDVSMINDSVTSVEEDWSEATTTTNSMALWCGEDQSNAYKNCNREGYDCPDGVCFNGLKCFMIGDACAEGEEETDDSSLLESDVSSESNNDGVLAQFCAKTFADLDSMCATATRCTVTEDCPDGEYCWKEFMCGGGDGSTGPPSPSSSILYSNSPSAVLSMSMSMVTYSPSVAEVDVVSFVLSTQQPVTESQQQTAGADEQQLFCASSMDELEASCTAAQSCISSACPKGMFCFPFTCATAAVVDTEDLTSSAPTPMAEATAGNQLQCPHSTFVGWHTSPDCKEYFECDNGEMGVVHMCNEGLKFDKVRNQCQDEMSVNSMCYGPAHTMSLSDGLCSDGYSGWESRNGCREYYWCDIGYADVIYDCGQDLLFDRSMELCNFANQVHCVENGPFIVSTDDADVQLPAPVSVPTPLVSVPTPLTSQPSPLTGMTLTTITGKDPPPQAAETEQQLFCASSMTELDTVSCTTAQSCISGPCPKGMFCFPYTCNNEYVGAGGVVGNYNWSDTTTRPPLQNATSSIETPPWLANTVFTNDNAGVASTMEYTMIIIVLSFFLVI